MMEETTTSTGTLTFTGDDSFQTPRSIPFDLATEILSKLSVKFLLKFSTTCKSWNSLINDPKFIKKHLRISTKRHRLITTTCIPSKKFTVMSYQLHSLPFNSIFNINATTQYEYSPVNHDYHDCLVASCDGIVCFAINQNVAVLWNPSIGKSKILPTLDTPKDGDGDGHTVYGFGYDPFVDNYKVVSVFYYNVYACKTEVSVYSLGTDCWRRIEDFPPLIPYGRQGVFVCGTINWLAYYDLNENDYYRSYAIVSLDLENETYHEILQPDYGEVVIEKLTLTLMRDCLCVFSHSDSFDDVWLMKEFGNDESWVKLIRIPHFSNRCLYFDNTKILYVFEDDNHVLLLMEEKFKLKWVVYDSKNDIVKCTKFQDFSWAESKVYVESLISP